MTETPLTSNAMQDLDSSGDEFPDFTGKVVVFYLKGGGTRSWGECVVLDYIAFKRMGGQLFVVGRMPPAVGTEWIWALQSGIAMDSVAHYLVFDSLEDYKQRAGRTEPSFWQKRFNRRAG